jgi:hypothetical protein
LFLPNSPWYGSCLFLVSIPSLIASHLCGTATASNTLHLRDDALYLVPKGGRWWAEWKWEYCKEHKYLKI